MVTVRSLPDFGCSISLSAARPPSIGREAASHIFCGDRSRPFHVNRSDQIPAAFMTLKVQRYGCPLLHSGI